MHSGKSGKKSRGIIPIVATLTFVILSACTGLEVVNVKDAGQLKSYGLIYALPKTVISIDVEMQRTCFVQGPYSEFAEEYLGIEYVIDKDEIKWQIKEFSLGDYLVPDSAHIYIIKGGNPASLQFLENGLLTAVNARQYDTAIAFSTDFSSLPDDIRQEMTTFYDVSVKKNLAESVDTSYKVIHTDSISRRIPVYSKYMTEKNIRKKAEEAANFILKIRKRRMHVLTAMDGKFPKGRAAEEILRKLDEMEEGYLDLFRGKTIIDGRIYRFSYCPVSGDEKSVLFYFSEQKGITDNKSGNPVYITLKAYNTWVPVDSLYARQEKPARWKKGVIYRVPDYADVRITDFSGRALAGSTCLISQFGFLQAMPARMLKDRQYLYIFSGRTGNLLKISKIPCK